MNRFYAVLTAMIVASSAYAQKTKISGTVVDANGESVPGVTVKVQGQKLATVTSIDGSFTIEADKNATLQFTSIGYAPVTVAVKGKTKIVVNLTEDSNELNEVLISVPYGTRKKSTFTGSAGVVGGEKIAASQVSSVSKALQGTVAGLQSFATSGQPGEDASVYIRGVGSVNASSTPLYVVDGVPYDGKLANISSQDIASVTVLKDAAAASLYGSRAANGVVMITTKQGSTGSAPTIELTAKYGFSSRAVSDYEQLSTDQYFELQWEALRNKYLNDGMSATDAAAQASSNVVGTLGINPYGSAYAQPVGTDGKIVSGAKALWDDSWEDALSQNAHYTDLSARVSGGSKNSKYYLSLGYLNDQGAYICSGFKRYNVRANVTSDLKKWLQIGLNLSAAHSSQSYPKQNDTMTSNVVLFARNLPSFYPVYIRNTDTGEYKLDENGRRQYDYGDYRTSSYAGMNLAQSMLYDKHDRNRDAATVQGFIQVKPIEDLTYKMTVNLDYNSLFQHDYTNPTYGKRPIGSSSKGNTRTTGFTVNNVINWGHVFNKSHDVHVMAGQEYYEYNTSNFSGERSNVIADGFYEPDVASTLVSFGGNSDQYKLLSFFGSAEYNYKRTYFVSASLRSDGSSRFAPSNRWGTFWSFGASWRIISEKWMESASSWLDNLTLRASYGAQGNDNVGYYAYQALYSIGSFMGQNALHNSRLATPELKWETNLNANVGLDFSLFGDRINGTIEYFQRASKDLLFSRDLVPSSGFSSTDANVGKLKNYGWEFTINGTPIRTKDWTWKLSVNATTYKNKIVKLPSEVMWSGTKKWVEGGSLYDYWLYEWAGVNPENGNPQWYYYDEDGNKLKTEDYNSLTSSDKVKCGNSLPTVSGGFSTDLTWKGITLSAQFSYALGGKLYNNDYVGMMGVTGGNGSTLSKDMMNRWTSENTQTDVPKVVADQSSYFTSSSSRWLVSRSYLRLKTLSLSYSLPRDIIKHALMRDASVFLQAENLLTFHKQQGLDPEQPLNGTVSYRYPAMKTISFGVNVKF